VNDIRLTVRICSNHFRSRCGFGFGQAQRKAPIAERDQDAGEAKHSSKYKAKAKEGRLRSGFPFDKQSRVPSDSGF
jgi:hypothetical protein